MTMLEIMMLAPVVTAVLDGIWKAVVMVLLYLIVRRLGRKAS